jgi:hypothetical protein
MKERDFGDLGIIAFEGHFYIGDALMPMGGMRFVACRIWVGLSHSSFQYKYSIKTLTWIQKAIKGKERPSDIFKFGLFVAGALRKEIASRKNRKNWLRRLSPIVYRCSSLQYYNWSLRGKIATFQALRRERHD